MSVAPGVVASLKVRVVSGCFHREHSPKAYSLIDDMLTSSSRAPAVSLVEHENGPEILVELALTTAGLGLAKSVIDLVVAIIKARGEGVRRGDRPDEPVELIVRRYDGSVDEETVLRIGARDPVDREEIASRLEEAVRRITGETQQGGERG